MAVALAVAVLWGFGASYFLRAFFPLDRLNLLVHVHGLLFTGWIALFLAQTALVARRRTDVHRRLGIAGIVLAAAMIAAGMAVDLGNVSEARQAAWEALEPGPLASFARLARMNSGNLVVFGLLVGTGVWLRHRPAAHKRLMTLACLALMNAPMARVLGYIGWPLVLVDGAGGLVAPDGFFRQTLGPLLGPTGFFDLIVLPLFVPLVVHDFVKLGRLHPATVFGGLVVFLFQPFWVLVLNVMGY